VANNTTIGFTLKVNGVDQAVTSIDALDQSIEQLESTLKSATFGSEEFKKVEQQLIKARSAKEDLDKSLEGRGAEKRLQGIVGMAESLGGAFAIASQASALFGQESEQVAAAELKAQQALSVVMGVRAIKEGLLNSSLERKLILEKAATAGTIVMNAVNKALNITLSMNPIGFIVTAIGLLVVGIAAAINPIKKFIAQFDFLGDAIQWTIDKARDLASWLSFGLIDDSATAKTRDNSEKIIESLDDIGSASNKMIAADKRRLAYMQAAGATEAQILAQKKKINKEEVASKQAAINALLKLQKIDGELSDEQKKKLVELTEAVKDLNNQANIDQVEFNKKQAEDRKKANEDAKRKQEERSKAYSDFVKEYQGKIAEANKKTKELENQATLNAIDSEDERARKSLEIQQKAQKDELQLAIDTINKKKNLSQQELAFRDALLKQMTQLDVVQAQETDKLTEDQAKKRKEKEEQFAKELEAIKNTTYLNGIENQRMRADEEARIQEEIAIRDIQNSERSETQKQQLIEAIKLQFDQSDKQRKETNRQEDIDRELAYNEQDIASNMTTFEQKLAILDENDALIKEKVFATEQERTDALEKNSEARKAIELAEFEYKASIASAGMDLAAQAGQFLQQIAGKNKGVAIAGIVIEQAAAIGKIVANTAVANAKSVAAMPITGGMPWVAINTASAALSIASTIAGAAKSISAIKSAGSDGGGGGGGGSKPAAPQPSKFASGGMVMGPGTGTSDSIPTLLSNGEVVINANSAAQFGSILSNINQAGGGVPIPSQAGDRGMAPQIIKTYVVASDMSSQQEADKRLNDIARI
jgi:hypothetical protein